jgi:hypothetical protein
MQARSRSTALLFSLLVFGCKRESPSAAVASASASSRASPGASLTPPVPLKPPACRAIRVRGDVRNDGGPITEMAPLEGRAWITLGEGAEVAVRHGASSRDFTLFGPGRFFPCRGGVEQVLIGSGRFKSSAGTGVRPGGDFTIATPFGSATYGDADLDAAVEAGKFTLEIRRGEVATEPVPGSKGLPEPGLRGPNGKAVVTGTPVPAEVVAACERAAKEAAESAERLMGAGGRAELGKEAAAQLTARRRARAVCASAEASLDRAADPALRGRLQNQVMAAERAWRTVPARPIPGPIPAR